MKTSNSLKIIVILTSFFSLATSRPAAADPNDWIIIQLTDNSYDDLYPKIDGQNVVWHGSDGNDFEIFLYNIDSNTTTQLTNNSYDDTNPLVSGSNVIWLGYNGPGATTEIYFYDGNSVTRLNNDAFTDGILQISGSYAAWSSAEQTGQFTWVYSLVVYDGNDTRRIIDNVNQASSVNSSISGPNVVYLGTDGLDTELYIHNIDANTITPLTSNNYSDASPSIDGSYITWAGRGGTIGSDWEILLYDGTTTTQITDNDYEDSAPIVSGKNMLWRGKDGGSGSDYDLFFYKGTVPIKLTVNEYNDNGSISGDNVVWSSYDGVDNEIFFYEGGNITQLTDNSTDDAYPKISGKNVVWRVHDGNDDEIFLAVPRCYPKPAADLNGDCKVNFRDLAILFSEWLNCNLYPKADCGN